MSGITTAKSPRMRVLVDCVGHQLDRVSFDLNWRDLIEEMSHTGQQDIYVLERSAGLSLRGVSVIPFPSYTYHYNASDSLLIQDICELYEIDVFISTGFTTPVAVPTMSLISDADTRKTCDLSERESQEREVSVLFSRMYLVTSRPALLAFRQEFPEIPPENIVESIDGHSVQALCSLVHRICCAAVATPNTDDRQFFARWASVRTIQSNVDVYGTRLIQPAEN